ncbi:MAG TPA: glycine zipper domain-containing protein [Pirellulales bacterium]|nr:glycine zipper domain-containing protein [Pirellulales bacterium]
MLRRQNLGVLLAAVTALATGCQSPYYADRGAALGGVTGAGVGALVGSAVRHPVAGALVGAGVGAVSGAAVGTGLDEIEARNRAAIAATMGRPVAPGAVAVDDVIAMSQAGVDENVIINHIRYNGVQRPPQTGDLIALQRANVGPRVIAALQAPPVQAAAGIAPPPPVVYPPPPPPWGYPVYYYPPPPPVGYGFGVAFR